VTADRSVPPDQDPDEAIADNDALYRVLVDGMSEGMVVQTADGGIVSANAAAQRILGLTAERMEGRTSEDLTWRIIHEDGTPFPGSEHPALMLLRTGRPQVNVVMGFDHPIQERRWLRVNARPLRYGPDGLPSVVVTTFADITAERLAIEALTVTQQRYQTLVETLPLVTYVDPIGLDRAVTFISPQVEAMFGFPVADWHDRPGGLFLDLLHPGDRARVTAWYEETAQVGDSAKLTYRMVARDGRTVWIEDASTNVRDPQTGETTAIGYLRDVTEEVDVQARLAEARDEAVRASSAKGDFLATMSHEIRTPMNGIVATVELLQDAGALDADGRELVRILGDAVTSLQDILDDVLDFSKIESGKATLHPEPFDVAATARGVVELLAPAAARKGVRLRADLDPTLPARLIGDPGMLRQVLLNLAGNAVKFTDEGEVAMSVQVVGGFGDRVTVVFEVRDTGPGIAASAMAELFEPFVQVDASAERRHGGTGLGLAISDRLARLMDGTLDVQSTLGEGATFTVTLPFAIASAAAQVDGAGVAEAGWQSTTLSGRVLLVEDNPTNRAVGLRQLARLGLDAEAVDGGEAGVRAVAETAWDCVLMDCQMPGMDGFAATRAIRAAEVETGRRTPIVAMTANAMQGDRETCLAAGMDDYLAKPVTLAALGGMLARWLGGTAAGATPGTDLDANASPSPTSIPPSGTDVGLDGGAGVREATVDGEIVAALREDLGGAVGELVGLYLRELPTRVAAVRAGVTARDGDAVAAAAHSLRGASATFGAAGLAALCAALEQAVREGRLADLAAAAAPLEALAAQTADALRAAVV